MLYTLKEVKSPGGRDSYQLFDPNGRMMVELPYYPMVEQLVAKLNRAVAKRHTHALGHTASTSLSSPAIHHGDDIET